MNRLHSCTAFQISFLITLKRPLTDRLRMSTNYSTKYKSAPAYLALECADHVDQELLVGGGAGSPVGADGAFDVDPHLGEGRARAAQVVDHVVGLGRSRGAPRGGAREDVHVL